MLAPGSGFCLFQEGKMGIGSSGGGARKSDRLAEIVYRSISDLIPNPRNPRRHTDKQIRQLARSIEALRFNVPILVDSNLNVLSGHARILACKYLGLTEVPTICLDHLTPSQAKAFMITDNRLTENADWDDRLLGELLKELSLEDLDFSIEVTGFDMGEIDLRIQGLSEVSESEHDPADVLPTDQPGIRVSSPGDLWLLNDHRVYCGNSLEDVAYKNLMDGSLADMIFADPPYNVPIDGHVGGLGSIHHREFAMASGEMSASEFTDFLTKAFVLLVKYSADGSLHYLCIDWRHLRELLAAGGKAYTELKNLAVWIKDKPGMGSLYRSQHELIFVYKNGRGSHRNNIQLGQFGRNRSNCWHYPGANSFGRKGDEGNLLALHPTVKPVALIADAILDCTARGDIVLDAFLGSGSTIIAAERVGRRCYGIEIDPLYVYTIVRRWESLTGRLAVHQSTGHSFKELEANAEKRNG